MFFIMSTHVALSATDGPSLEEVAVSASATCFSRWSILARMLSET